MSDENDFANMFIEIMFDDINGKNREIITLKYKLTVLTKEIEALKTQMNDNNSAAKDEIYKLKTRIIELEEDNKNLICKLEL